MQTVINLMIVTLIFLFVMIILLCIMGIKELNDIQKKINKIETVVKCGDVTDELVYEILEQLSKKVYLNENGRSS